MKFYIFPAGVALRPRALKGVFVLFTFCFMFHWLDAYAGANVFMNDIMYVKYLTTSQLKLF